MGMNGDFHWGGIWVLGEKKKRMRMRKGREQIKRGKVKVIAKVGKALKPPPKLEVNEATRETGEVSVDRRLGRTL